MLISFQLVQPAGEEVIEGVVGSVINHPLETAILCIGGPQYLLAYHIGKIAYAYVDIKIASLMDEEAGGQKLADYLQPLTDCVVALYSGDITLRGSIKFGATVATQVLLQGKVNDGLREFYKTTKERAKNLFILILCRSNFIIRNSSRKAPVTP